MSTRRDEIKNETKELIYNESIRRFKEKGVHNTTVEEITKGVGIAKGTFFNYYTTKEHVLSEYYRLTTQQVIAKLRKRNYSSLMNAILDFGNSLAETAIKEKKLFLHVGRSKKINKTIAQEDILTSREIDQYIRELFNQFEVDMDENERRTSVDIILSLILATFQQWRISEGYKDLPVMIKERFTFIFKNISTNPQKPELKKR